jgi:hypothetical protein
MGRTIFLGGTAAPRDTVASRAQASCRQSDHDASKSLRAPGHSRLRALASPVHTGLKKRWSLEKRRRCRGEAASAEPLGQSRKAQGRARDQCTVRERVAGSTTEDSGSRARYSQPCTECMGGRSRCGHRSKASRALLRRGVTAHGTGPGRRRGAHHA